MNNPTLGDQKLEAMRILAHAYVYLNDKTQVSNRDPAWWARQEAAGMAMNNFYVLAGITLSMHDFFLEAGYAK